MNPIDDVSYVSIAPHPIPCVNITPNDYWYLGTIYIKTIDFHLVLLAVVGMTVGIVMTFGCIGGTVGSHSVLGSCSLLRVINSSLPFKDLLYSYF